MLQSGLSFKQYYIEIKNKASSCFIFYLPSFISEKIGHFILIADVQNIYNLTGGEQCNIGRTMLLHCVKSVRIRIFLVRIFPHSD